MRKQLDSAKIIDSLNSLSELFKFRDLKFDDLQNAASLNWKDFEDAIQFVTAERVNADYIITRNTKDFQNSKIPALTPNEFLEKFHI